MIDLLSSPKLKGGCMVIGLIVIYILSQFAGALFIVCTLLLGIVLLCLPKIRELEKVITRLRKENDMYRRERDNTLQRLSSMTSLKHEKENLQSQIERQTRTTDNLIIEIAQLKKEQKIHQREKLQYAEELYAEKDTSRRKCLEIERKCQETLDRYNATQQLYKIHGENECLKLQIIEQDKMLAQHQLKQLESENKLCEENQLSKQKCEKVEREMEKLITRSNEEIENIKTVLVQHELDSQMYKDICISYIYMIYSLTEYLRKAMTDGYSLETQLQTTRKEIQQTHAEFEQYKESSNKRYDAIKTELQIARMEFQKQHEIYAEYEHSSKRKIYTMETQLQTVGIKFQKEHEEYEEYKKSSRKKIGTMETQLQTIWIEMWNERETYEEYEKLSKKIINTLETQLQTRWNEMLNERETYEEYEKSSRKIINTMLMENNNYKEFVLNLMENKENLENKLQGLQNTAAATNKELERMKKEKTIKDVEKTQHCDFYSKHHVDAIYKILSAKSDYDRLGIHPGATKTDVRTAFKKLSLLVHPDKNEAPGSEDAFKILQNAKEALYKICS